MLGGMLCSSSDRYVYIYDRCTGYIGAETSVEEEGVVHQPDSRSSLGPSAETGAQLSPSRFLWNPARLACNLDALCTPLVL
jgi:hypothetical protein